MSVSVISFYTKDLKHKDIFFNLINNHISLIEYLKIYKVYTFQKLTRFATNNGAQHICIKIKINKEIAEKYKDKPFKSIISGREYESDIYLKEGEEVIFEVHISAKKVINIYKIDSKTPTPRYQSSFSIKDGLFYGEVTETFITHKLAATVPENTPLHILVESKLEAENKLNLTAQDVLNIFDYNVYLLEQMQQYLIVAAFESAANTNLFVNICKSIVSKITARQNNKYGIFCSQQVIFSLLNTLLNIKPIDKLKMQDIDKLMEVTAAFSPFDVIDYLKRNKFASEEVVKFKFLGKEVIKV